MAVNRQPRLVKFVGRVWRGRSPLALIGLLAIFFPRSPLAAADVTWNPFAGSTQWDHVLPNWDHDGSSLTPNVAFQNADNVMFTDASSGTIDVSGNISPGQTIVDSSNAYTLQGEGLIGSGSLVKRGAGTLTLKNINQYLGGTLIEAGVLKLGNNNVLPIDTDLLLNGNLDLASKQQTVGRLTGSGSVINSTTTTGTLTLNLNNESMQFDGAIGSLTGNRVRFRLTGVGRFDLSGTIANSLTANVVHEIVAGELRFMADERFDPLATLIVQSAGSLDMLGHDQTFSALPLSGMLRNSAVESSLLTLRGTTVSNLTGSISGAISFKIEQVGAKFSGNNSFIGAIDVNASTLSLAGIAPLGNSLNVLSTHDSSVDLGSTTLAQRLVASGAFVQLSVATGQAATVTGDIELSPGTEFRKIGAGSVTLTGAVSGRQLRVNQGTLTISGPQNYLPGSSLNLTGGTARLLSDGGSNLTINVNSNGDSSAVDLSLETSQHIAGLNIGPGGHVRLGADGGMQAFGPGGGQANSKAPTNGSKAQSATDVGPLASDALTWSHETVSAAGTLELSAIFNSASVDSMFADPTMPPYSTSSSDVGGANLVTAVPEPSTLVLLFTAAAIAVFCRRRLPLLKATT